MAKNKNKSKKAAASTDDQVSEADKYAARCWHRLMSGFVVLGVFAVAVGSGILGSLSPSMQSDVALGLVSIGCICVLAAFSALYKMVSALVQAGSTPAPTRANR